MAKNKTVSYFLILFCLLISLMTTQQTYASPTTFDKTYGGTGDDEAYSLVKADDAGYVISGFTSSYGAGGYDFWLIKTDYAGNMVWNQTYGGSGDDKAFAMVKATDGGYALAGYTNSSGAGKNDFWLVKTDGTGKMEWNKTYGDDGDDEAYALVHTSDGGYAIAGMTTETNSSGHTYGWLIKTDTNGNMLWSQKYSGASYSGIYSIVQASDDNYVAAMDLSDTPGFSDARLIRADSEGNIVWNTTFALFGGPLHTFIACIIKTNDNGYALAGDTTDASTIGFEAWILKTDSNGKVQWNQKYGSSGNDQAYALTQTIDGGYAMVGSTSADENSAGNAVLWKYYSNGTIEQATQLSQSNSAANAVLQLEDSSYLICGSSNFDFWLKDTITNDIPELNVTLLLITALVMLPIAFLTAGRFKKQLYPSYD